jgi:lysophospholipase L1-like esterase
MKNARAILGRAKVKYNVVMIGPPAIDDDKQNIRIKAYDEAYAMVCKMLGINYLSIFNRLINDNEWREEINFNEDAHPIEKGYERLAQYIYSWDGWWFA